MLYNITHETSSAIVYNVIRLWFDEEILLLLYLRTRAVYTRRRRRVVQYRKKYYCQTRIILLSYYTYNTVYICVYLVYPTRPSARVSAIFMYSAPQRSNISGVYNNIILPIHYYYNNNNHKNKNI